MEQILTNKKEEYIQKADGRILLQTILILTAVMLDLLGIIRILGRLNRFLPLAGILIAISIFLVIRTRNEPAN